MGINAIRSLHANMENGTQTGSIYGVFVFLGGGSRRGKGYFSYVWVYLSVKTTCKLSCSYIFLKAIYFYKPLEVTLFLPVVGNIVELGDWNFLLFIWCWEFTICEAENWKEPWVKGESPKSFDGALGTTVAYFICDWLFALWMSWKAIWNQTNRLQAS